MTTRLLLRTTIYSAPDRRQILCHCSRASSIYSRVHVHSENDNILPEKKKKIKIKITGQLKYCIIRRHRVCIIYDIECVLYTRAKTTFVRMIIRNRHFSTYKVPQGAFGAVYVPALLACDSCSGGPQQFLYSVVRGNATNLWQSARTGRSQMHIGAEDRPTLATRPRTTTRVDR